MGKTILSPSYYCVTTFVFSYCSPASMTTRTTELFCKKTFVLKTELFSPSKAIRQMNYFAVYITSNRPNRGNSGMFYERSISRGNLLYFTEYIALFPPHLSKSFAGFNSREKFSLLVLSG